MREFVARAFKMNSTAGKWVVPVAVELFMLLKVVCRSALVVMKNACS